MANHTNHHSNVPVRDIHARNALLEIHMGAIYAAVKQLPDRPKDCMRILQGDAEGLAHLKAVRCAELWDGGRGCKFSTYFTAYVYKDIRREAAKEAKRLRRLRPLWEGDHWQKEVDEATNFRRGRLEVEAEQGLRDAVKLLPKRLRRLLAWRWGLGGIEHGCTHREMAKLMGVTFQRVQQLEKVAFAELRKILSIYCSQEKGRA